MHCKGKVKLSESEHIKTHLSLGMFGKSFSKITHAKLNQAVYYTIWDMRTDRIDIIEKHLAEH